jgi:hypothetical protein
MTLSFIICCGVWHHKVTLYEEGNLKKKKKTIAKNPRMYLQKQYVSTQLSSHAIFCNSAKGKRRHTICRMRPFRDAWPWMKHLIFVWCNDRISKTHGKEDIFFIVPIISDSELLAAFLARSPRAPATVGRKWGYRGHHLCLWQYSVQG